MFEGKGRGAGFRQTPSSQGQNTSSMKGSIVYGLNGLRVKLGRKWDRPVHLEVGLPRGNLAAKFCRQWNQLGSTCCLVATRTRNRNATSANAGKRSMPRNARSVVSRDLRCLPLRNVRKAGWLRRAWFALAPSVLITNRKMRRTFEGVPLTKYQLRQFSWFCEHSKRFSRIRERNKWKPLTGPHWDCRCILSDQSLEFQMAPR